MCTPAERLAHGGAALLSIPEARPDNPGGAGFPLGLQPADGALHSLPELLAWADTHAADVEAALLAHGGLLLRGFPLADAAAFDAFMVRPAHVQPAQMQHAVAWRVGAACAGTKTERTDVTRVS
jgi:hypothetical protein